MRLPASTTCLLLLLLTSCDSSVDPMAGLSGGVNGYIYGVYSECREQVDKSGFTVSLLHSSKTAVTDRDGYFSISGLELGMDTIIVTKIGYESRIAIVKVTPEVDELVTISGCSRLNSLEAQFTSEWSLVPTQSELYIDSLYVNSYGDLVKVQIYRVAQDTLLTIEATSDGSPSAYTHIRLAARRDGEREMQKGIWNSLHDIVVRTGNSHSVSLHELRSYDNVRSGDTLYAYVQAIGPCGSLDRGQYTDMKQLIIP